MNRLDFSFRQYEILLDQDKLNHTRWNDQIKIFLTFSTVIAAGKGALIQYDRLNNPTLSALNIFLSCIGFIACIAAIISVIRIRNLILVNYSQINLIESQIKDVALAEDLFFIESSTEKNDFFRNRRPINGLTFKPFCLRSFLQLPIIVILFSFFAVGFFIDILYPIVFRLIVIYFK